MSVTIDFYFDFGSPNAYLAYRVLPGLAEAVGAEITFKPALLGGIFKATGNQSPMQAFGPIKGKLAYEMLELERFVERHALTKYQMNPNFPINTLAMMRAMMVAEDMGVADPYREACFTAMWEEGLNMGDTDVAVKRIAETGLDADALFSASQAPENKQKLIDATAAAVERGVFGLPTFFVGEEMFFGKDRLGQVVEEVSRVG
ncbi:MAG: 2-hydroxychromene-2-carboxylate isomerase [Pseudomonadota bacterium]